MGNLDLALPQESAETQAGPNRRPAEEAPSKPELLNIAESAGERAKLANAA